ncbi:MAG: AraC family transcriptional regulator [Acidobacteriaceae bacterium]|nr:AraC family transcriptional regulator [Acidobacteriaceae bacterium]
MTAIRSQYGEALLRTCKVNTNSATLPILATRSLQGLQIAAVHVVIGQEQLGGPLNPIPPEDTFVVRISPTGVARHEVWSKGRPFSKDGFIPYSMNIGHLSHEYQIRNVEPYEVVSILIRRTSLDAFTNEEGYRRVANLSCPSGIVDAKIGYLVRTLLPFFARPQEANAAFVDHALLSITTRLIDQYSGVTPSPVSIAKGGLSPVLLQRVKEMLAGDLKGELLVGDIAKECGLSRDHLGRAFKISTGSPLHRWRQWRRVDAAKDLLKRTELSLNDIAFRSGFIDQSHMTRVFATLDQASPAAWRRQNRS